MWVIGNADDRRITLLQRARQQQGLQPAHIVSYYDIVQGKALPIPDHAVVRIESPGKDAVLHQLMCGLETTEAPPKGLWQGTQSWYSGFQKILEQLTQHGQPKSWQFVNHPRDIALMFDKTGCQNTLRKQGLAVPKQITNVTSYETLRQQMQVCRTQRAFIKPRYGSSGAGIIAYAIQQDREQAISTLEYSQDGQLYTTRRLVTYRDSATIRKLVNLVCRDSSHVEVWLPKAGYGNHCFDVRVVVINGKAQHIVVRTSKQPITNLHLLNPRGTIALARKSIGEPAWQAGIAACEQAGMCFPNSLYTGIDLLFTPNGDHALLEVNAFGDLLPGIMNEAGDDTYTSELKILQCEGN